MEAELCTPLKDNKPEFPLHTHVGRRESTGAQNNHKEMEEILRTLPRVSKREGGLWGQTREEGRRGRDGCAGGGGGVESREWEQRRESYDFNISISYFSEDVVFPQGQSKRIPGPEL